MIIYTSWYTQENPGGMVEYCAVTIMWFCSKAIQFFILGMISTYALIFLYLPCTIELLVEAKLALIRELPKHF